MSSKNFFSTALLLFTAYATIATSSGDGTPFVGNYQVVSDCVTPVRDQTVTISSSQVTGGGSFTDFGFPVATLSTSMTGTVGAVTRTCKLSYGDPDKLNLDSSYPTIYACFDNGAFKCTIFMKPL